MNNFELKCHFALKKLFCSKITLKLDFWQMSSGKKCLVLACCIILYLYYIISDLQVIMANQDSVFWTIHNVFFGFFHLLTLFFFPQTAIQHPLCHRIYLTRLQTALDADRFFPAFEDIYQLVR